MDKEILEALENYNNLKQEYLLKFGEDSMSYIEGTLFDPLHPSVEAIKEACTELEHAISKNTPLENVEPDVEIIH